MIQIHKFIFYTAHIVGVRTGIVKVNSKSVKAAVEREMSWIYATIVTCFTIFLGIIDVLNLIEYLTPVRLKIYPSYYFYVGTLFTLLATVFVWYVDLEKKIMAEIKELSTKRKHLLAVMSVLYVVGLVALLIFLKRELYSGR